ncbi:MAG: hypothetical protein GF416_08210 [Candidatus Altiarchaeales archaeon]|nr:hypothetical protein [Candidatus Altiarchaeales archaeon]MBD3417098.1 hypothetical protein [Candidatus Altiarchaeales archaeon]
MGAMKDKQDILEEFLESLDCPIIVEGRRDAEALMKLDVDEGDIVVLNKGQSLLETVEALQDCSEVIILTDMDRAGKVLRKKLLKMMGAYGIHEKRRPRELFSQLRLSHVEGL